MAENQVFLLSRFPDFTTRGFDIKQYNQQFWERNSVISATSTNVYYDKHWGPLSLKFVLKGEEYYQTDNSRYMVGPSNFLVLNNNTEYSSFIDADEDVQSFTLNFCEKYVSGALTGLMCQPAKLLDDKSGVPGPEIRFVERTYSKEKTISTLLYKMTMLVPNFEERNDEISELFNEFLYNLLLLNKKVDQEIDTIKALKYSTKEELYKRLNYARDYIECCFDQDIDLTKMASIACLNREYFIRQFKLYVGITPAQYLIRKRMEVARNMILSNTCSISEICRRVGYTDLTSFGKLFRKYYHASPEAFRSRSSSNSHC